MGSSGGSTTFSGLLRGLRTAAAATQERVGSILGASRGPGGSAAPVSGKTISGWERGAVVGATEGETHAEERARFAQLEERLVSLAQERGADLSWYESGSLLRAWEVETRRRTRGGPVGRPAAPAHRRVHKDVAYTVATIVCRPLEDEQTMPFVLRPDLVYEVEIKLVNTGTSIWRAAVPTTGEWASSERGPMRLGTWRPQDRMSFLYDPETWTEVNRPAGLRERSVQPEGQGTFAFLARAPERVDRYVEWFNLVCENYRWSDSEPLSLIYEVVAE